MRIKASLNEKRQSKASSRTSGYNSSRSHEYEFPSSKHSDKSSSYNSSFNLQKSLPQKHLQVGKQLKIEGYKKFFPEPISKNNKKCCFHSKHLLLKEDSM
jgi:hypothetical protein